MKKKKEELMVDKGTPEVIEEIFIHNENPDNIRQQ